MTSSPVMATNVEPTLLRAANLLQLFPLLLDPRDPSGVRHRLDVILTVCSQTMVQAQPSRVAGWIRGHRGIENGLH